MSMEHEHYELVMNYIKDIFDFRKSINHKITNYQIENLIKQLNYNLNKEEEYFESYYSCGESEILTNFDENLVHFCMIHSGFRVKQENDFFKYNVSIKPKTQRLLQMYND